MTIFNLLSGELDIPPDAADPPGYASSAVRVGPKLGAERIGLTVYELPPGEAVCPYHFEWGNEEWLVVLSGRPTLRTPEGERALEPGDTACFPEGPAGAHFVRNDGDKTSRVAIFSTKDEPSLAEYPDSDKIGVWVKGTHYMLRRSEHLDYWDGER